MFGKNHPPGEAYRRIEPCKSIKRFILSAPQAPPMAGIRAESKTGSLR